MVPGFTPTLEPLVPLPQRRQPPSAAETLAGIVISKITHHQDAATTRLPAVDIGDEVQRRGQITALV